MAYKVLDISKYNNIGDYQLASNDIDGVIIRAGYRGYGSSGTLVKDDSFDKHYNGFSGKTKIGIYWFTQATSVKEAEDEADFLYNIIKNLKIDFPIYIDSEYSNTSHDGRADSLTTANRTQYLIAFCDKMISYGYRVGVYASDSWYVNQLEYNSIKTKNYSIWVANYSSQPSRVTQYDGWQYTSKGVINGSTGNFDLTNFYTDVAGWTIGSIDIFTLDCKLDLDEVTFYGGENRPVPIIKDGQKLLVAGTDYTIEYKNNINAGTGSAICKGINVYKGSVTLNFTIERKLIFNLSITCGEPDSDGCYDINNLKITYGALSFIENIDYILDISYEAVKGFTYAIIRVSGIGNYYGFDEVRLKVEVTETRIDILFVDCELIDEVFTYDGKPKKASIKLTYNSYTLVEDKDYTLEYMNNVNAGQAIIIYRGIGDNYMGDSRTSFLISQLSIVNSTITCGEPDSHGNYNLSNLEIIKNGLTLQENIDYTLIKEFYNRDNNIIANLTIIGELNFTDRLNIEYQVGQEESKDINDLTLNIDGTEFIYNGEECIPIVNIYDGDIRLIENKNYIIKYYNNINPGTAYGIIEPIGSEYYNSRRFEFIINKIDITNGIMNCGEPDSDGCYNLNNISISVNGINIIKNTDYEYSVYTQQYETYIESVVTAIGKGNYKGRLQGRFKINNNILPIEYADIKLSTDSFIYDTTNLMPTLVTSLVENVDYTVSFPKESINSGVYNIIIYGIGRYKGQVILKYEITKRSVEDFDIYFGEKDPDGFYNTDNIVISFDHNMLRDNIDYTLSIDRKERENGYIVSNCLIIGSNNYQGSRVESIVTGRKNIYTGKKVILEKAPLFSRYSLSSISDRKSGEFYLWDDKVVNNKIRITNREEYVGKNGFITGWININNLEHREKLNIGDRVIVDGIINTYADGSGNNILEKNVVMTIVDILNSDQFEYCYGLASSINRTRIGWAQEEILSLLD